MTYSQQGVQNFVLDSHDDGGGGERGVVVKNLQKCQINMFQGGDKINPLTLVSRYRKWQANKFQRKKVMGLKK